MVNQDGTAPAADSSADPMSDLKREELDLHIQPSSEGCTRRNRRADFRSIIKQHTAKVLMTCMLKADRDNCIARTKQHAASCTPALLCKEH